MLSTCTIYRKTGATTTDADGIKVPVWDVVYTGKCRIAGLSRGAPQYRVESPADTQIPVGFRYANFPHGTVLADGDLIDVTDGDSVGVWQVEAADRADQQTAYRVPVVAADRPIEWGA